MSNLSLNNALVVKNVSKTVSSPEGKLTILSNIDFIVTKGESVAIVGASGAGKSTLLGLMAGLDTTSTGKIFLNGHELSDMDEDGRADVRAKNVGFIFQSFHLIPSLNALENVMLPLELVGKQSAKKIAQEILFELGLKQRITHYPHQLSGGEKQRVAIARAFASEPTVLFADEPTGNLDTKTGENIMKTMFKLNQESTTTLILVTHDKALASMCKREIILDAGLLVKDSKIEK
ncbi:ABC transporter ATP-binding protein [Woeseiaceae bacterium]|jgi:putative ABC transport system ATP-binding protein|nr:ABC transporter ATP-binding protein [Woeseiaceae bacterium]MDB2543838.1 ABC transporter ATP-binding protein [Woeseiaceae bacterium]|tara:strand:- start:262 stop:963 length:702 start_codon:yes stop_codon:yes gene_type:complete